MSIKCQEVIKRLEALAPTQYAEAWDNVGLQVGDGEQMVSKIMMALTPSEGIIQQAEAAGCDLLVCHHPLIFKPTPNITTKTALGRSVLRLAKAGICQYSAHTNLDTTWINHALAEALGLLDLEPLSVHSGEVYYKLAVYVPEGYEETIRAAICAAGGGQVGQYSQCTFQSAGTGTFFAHEGTAPFLGEIGQLTRAAEYRLETIVPKKNLAAVLQAMLAAHPYEEAAYDIYPLANEIDPKGIGLVGNLPQALDWAQFLQKTAEVLALPSLTYSGQPKRSVRRVALCGGSGAGFMALAKNKGADVYLTGDMKYHDGQLARELDLCVVDGTHFATERLGVRALAAYLRQNLAGQAEVVLGDEQDFWQIYQQ